VLVESVLASDAWPNEVRIAFDGDAVLFSDEAERVFQAEGLDAFQAHELSKADLPLPEGPFKPLLMALHRLQMAGNAQMRIRTALVTARSAPAHERAIRTLMNWNIRVDEAMFLGGLPKGEFLREFEPDFFFDDQTGHVDAGRRAASVPAGARAPSSGDVEHIVILMQENRSFDHYFGTLMGVRGFGDRFTIPLPKGRTCGSRAMPPASRCCPTTSTAEKATRSA
jgi:hypothetical protein